jgi:hypothetical protein
MYLNVRCAFYEVDSAVVEAAKKRLLDNIRRLTSKTKRPLGEQSFPWGEKREDLQLDLTKVKGGSAKKKKKGKKGPGNSDVCICIIMINLETVYILTRIRSCV